MSKPTVSPGQLLSFVERVISHVKPGVRSAAEVWVEYHDENYNTHRMVQASSIRMMQSEHGPMKIIISESL